MAWTVPGSAKGFEQNSSWQGQGMWPGQFPAGTRDLNRTVPGSDKGCGLDSSPQGQGI